VIVKSQNGWRVVSHKKNRQGHRKNLGGPYQSRAQAQKRLKQVEMFKHLRKRRGL
jgi:hypothetical protein